MARAKKAFRLVSLPGLHLKDMLLNWLGRFSSFVLLDTNNDRQYAGRYELLAGAGICELLPIDKKGMTDVVDRLSDRGEWIFGHICYDYKNALEPYLFSRKPGRLGFEQTHFFVPETVIYQLRDQDTFWIESLKDPVQIFNELCIAGRVISRGTLPSIHFEQRVTEPAYCKTIGTLQRHIAAGDCYEINYCAEAYCSDVLLEPAAVYAALNELSSAPFSAFYRSGHLFAMCASPERFLYKSGCTLTAQPMKGTAARSEDATEDERRKQALRNSEKECAENVMITDLMRNDLAKCCVPGSIAVPELFRALSFNRVHQLISTITGSLSPGISSLSALISCFPMGSMTGAPKTRVMQLIEEYEVSQRELFSGTIGYFNPEGDFDFNVVIRSLFYNERTRYLSYHTGGAITIDSTAEGEWNERLLKAWAMERLFWQQ